MKRTIPKPRHEMNIDELIVDSGWFNGSGRDWDAIPMEQRQDIAFAATGCKYAYATWRTPVNCLHSWCRVQRGEIKAITILNSQMHWETKNGWWSDISRITPAGRKRLATIYRSYRKAAMKQRVYDIWQLGGAETALIGLL